MGVQRVQYCTVRLLYAYQIPILGTYTMQNNQLQMHYLPET